jgi:sugar/nucleoside kinase (ribokinase family)
VTPHDWGVAAYLKKCGYNMDHFYSTGEVTFQGTNVIEGNDTSGNHMVEGNPGNHPFKDLPDGQVCLP